MTSLLKNLLCTIALCCIMNGLLAQRADTLYIHFDFDRSDLRPEAAASLDSLYATAGGIARIEISGHCDHVGNHAYNDALSSRRVEQARNYLVQKGINHDLFVKIEAMGKRQPLNENKTEEERFMNRRVELIVHRQAAAPPVTVTPPARKDSVPSLTDIIKDSTTKAGNNIILRNLQFIPGRHILLPESEPVLDELFIVMRDNPTLEIEIQGHVCCTASNTDGLDMDLGTYNLSVQRARAITQLLIGRGISEKRMTFRGFGGSRKLYPLERTEFERQENRRVELRIVKR
jgi:outer membrane protein OmpA-like peptidoglycan-associated protein